MNHKKFIELLNLYVDGEASPLEAREVEHEIAHDPARRRIYNEYCRIQVATRAMYDQFRTAAEEARPEARLSSRLRAAGVRSAVAQPGRVPGPPFRRFVFWAGGAAAACMALALAFWSMPRAGAPQPTVETAESTGVSVPTIAAAPVAVAATQAPADAGSYTAPFAAGSRADPYVIGGLAPAADPFVLSPSLRPSDFGDPEVILSGVPSFEAARFSPAGLAIDPARIAEDNRRLQAILRNGIAPQSRPAAPIVPVNYRPQP